MTLKSIIDAELSKKGKTFKWLVGEVGISHDGLKAGLENETIKLRDFKKMMAVLNLPIQNYFEGATIQKIKGDHNNQNTGMLMNNEPDAVYKKLQVDSLIREIELLRSQLADKDKIIELLSNK